MIQCTVCGHRCTLGMSSAGEGGWAGAEITISSDQESFTLRRGEAGKVLFRVKAETGHEEAGMRGLDHWYRPGPHRVRTAHTVHRPLGQGRTWCTTATSCTLPSVHC